ncbi:MAG: tetratricopeptide repeat-containing sulfotransferase family protein [Gammaproteobacteria bacterium]
MNVSSAHAEDIAAAFRALQAGELTNAERICAGILHAAPGHAEANNCLGIVRRRLGFPEQAVELFEKAVASDPMLVPAYQNLANALMQLNRVDDARAVVKRALDLRPDPAIANRALGDLGYQVAEYAKAEAFYRRALAAAPTDFDSHAGLGMALRRLGRLAEAQAHYQRAIELQPGNASVHLNLGNILSATGRIDESIESYREAIRLRPDYARAHQLLASVRKHESCDAELLAMKALFDRSDISTEDRMNLAFGLGKAFEELQDYDAAFEYYRQGNAAKRAGAPYAADEDIELFSRLEATFDADFLDSHQGLGSDDGTPIFILGMPRSGTSLVEQILASHPQVHGAGELGDVQIVCKGAVDAFPEQVAQLPATAWRDMADAYLKNLRGHDAKAKHITDKMPQNFQYIGMIAIMFPNAKIIHCRRDPMDTCVSIYKNLFASSDLRWSYDIDDLGRYYQLYRRLMAHWRRVLPRRIYEIDYEKLVGDFEQETRNLLDHCGLPFDPGCLSFHESTRAVETASFAQVRKPIYGDSIGRWRHYARHVQSLVERCEAGQSADDA